MSVNQSSAHYNDIKSEWEKLPKLKGIENLRDVGKIPIELYGSIHRFADNLSKQWISKRAEYERQTEYQEDLVAVLMSAAISYATQEFHRPGRLQGNPSNTAIDRVIAVAPHEKLLENEVNGSTVQIVCTYGIKLPKKDVNTAVIERIEHKHKKGEAYADGVQLAVFVTQEDWKVDITKLTKEIEKNRQYSSYWVILPLLEQGQARFIINYLGLDAHDRGQGQIVVDIKDGIKARFLSLYMKDGRLDDIETFVKYMKDR